MVTQRVDLASLIAKAERVGKIAEAEAYEADRNARFSDKVARAIEEAELHKLLRPKRYGGFSVTPRTFAKVIRTVGRYNIAAGWLVYFYPVHEVWVAYLPPEGREEIFNKGGFVADVVAPVGRVERDGDGYRLYGQWDFASGILWADWIGLGAPVQLPDGDGPETCLLAVPTSELKVVENWNTLGLRASASNRVVADGVWVPLRRVLPLRIKITGKPLGGEVDEDEPIYRVPFMPLFASGFPVLALAGAERLVDIFQERTEKRARPYEKMAREKEKPVSHRLLGELRVKLETLEALVDRYVDQLESWVQEGRTVVSDQEAGRMFAWRAQAAELAGDIAHRVLVALGGNAHFKGDPVELFARDLLTLESHASHLYEDAMTWYGGTMYGLPAHPVWS